MGKKIDLVGQRFTRLFVREDVGRDKHGRVLYLCECDCGNETVVTGKALRSQHTQSCGCFKRERTAECKKIDLTGHRYGRLVALYENGRDKHGNVLWHCLCDCGNETDVTRRELRTGDTKSCGCLARESHTTHGMYKTRIYIIWGSMLTRTGIWKGADEQTKREYQDRGITVCDEWLVFENFRDWALSNGYRDDLQIDRIDNDKGYCPENCRWVTPKENCNNRRNTLRLEDGTPLATFCAEVGIETRGGNGKATKQYDRILAMCRRGKIHPELLQKANEYLTLLKRLKASLDLLAEVREFRHEHKIRDPKRATN